MSTKLFDGTRYPMSVGAERYGRMLVEAVKPAHERLVAEATGRMLHAATWAHLSGKDVYLDTALDDTLVQKLALTNDADSVSGLIEFLPAVERVLEAAAKSDRRIDPAISLELTVWFIADPDGGDWGYAYPFASNDELRSVWPSLPGVEEYGYWNNTDAPDDMDPQEWRERSRTWTRVVGCSFAEHGVKCEPEIPSAFMLYLDRRDWFLATALRGFVRAEVRRRRGHASARTRASQELIARMLTNHGQPTTAEDVAAAQERDDAEFAARFQ